MKKRRLGANGPEVSAIGLGCMAMSVNAYGAPDPDEALATLKAAIDNGLNFFTPPGTMATAGTRN